MDTQRFAHTQAPISNLVAWIETGDLSLPDLQRPFVWKRNRVRELFDSLYHGYPAGYFLFWSTPTPVDSHRIGSNPAGAKPLKMIVDGQQRLTSLYAVIRGKQIVTENNEVQAIRIAFNPLTEEFAVADAATDADPEWVDNISEIWTSPRGQYQFITDHIDRLAVAREVAGDERQRMAENLSRLAQLPNYQFSILDLSSELDIDEVAEVFVRINSAGVALNSADFILTLMSVHTPEARHRLEDFARQAKVPATTAASAYNHFHAPSPDELLRVAVGLGLTRGVLQNAYHALRGRDPKTKVVSEATRSENFAKLLAAQEHVLDLTNWHGYLAAVKRAGYRSGDMLTSTNNFLYGYLVYLLGRHHFQVPSDVLREAVARWFFMSALTGRYTGSPETVVEADLRRLGEASSADEFVAVIDRVIETHLTTDYWAVTLPDNLDSSAAWSPYLFAYYASLNLLGAKALFSNLTINELFDPGVKATRKPVERHHLFPKAYLSSIGITGSTRTNQIANYAFVEWGDNGSIGDSKPSEYFPGLAERLAPTDREQAMFWHALPPDWEHMEYADFLRERRLRIAAVVRAGFDHLRSGGRVSLGPALEAPPSVEDLLRQMETERVEFKKSARAALDNDAPEKVINEGVIKTVAAFLNSHGGTLGIGISDDGDIVGIQHDLDLKRQDLDAYQNWLTSLLISSIGAGAVGAHVGIRMEAIQGQVVCLVDVRPSPSPVYASTIKGDSCFYVRVANTTRQLTGPDLVNYINGHWR